jgi:4-hydroxythreonine-4-phosphate dehydrogenase
MPEKLRVGITVGDFNGIGPELILKTLSNDAVLNYCTPVVYGNPYVFKFYANLLEIPALDFRIANNEKEIQDARINLRVCNKEQIEITPGEASESAGAFALAALEMAVNDIKDGLIQNLLTAPLDKNSVSLSHADFNGHTAYLAGKFDSDELMILLNDEIKVSMVTGHTAIEQVAASLTEEKLIKCISKLHDALRSDFGILKPRIAVLGLNPHSGDKGLMGKQESEIIEPAISKAQDADLLVVGPYAPDGFFGSGQAKQFDAVLGMYHDQVLIPFKQMAFSSGVNYTAGLPMVRTSPDHGTAYDIAGKGEADISSFVNALFLINRINRRRLEFYGGPEFLPFREHRREKFSIGVPDLD